MSITKFGDYLDPWHQAVDEVQATPAGDCSKHPGTKWRGCAPCAIDDTARMLADRRADVEEAATHRCDRLFPRRYIDAHTTRADVITWINGYLDAPTDTPGLLLLGPTGTGKTWQAYAALRRAVTHPRPTSGVGFRADAWQAATYADLLASMRPGGDRDPEAILNGLRTVPLLLVDDLGIAKQSEWVEDVTYRLINGRYEDMRPSIFTSNLSVDNLRDAVGDRIASRLAETCTRVVLTGDDRRRTPKDGGR